MEGKRTMIKPRPIDHLVLPVGSLAVARSRFENLGFQVQPDRQHPFGTQNCCIMFSNRTYLEPLAPGNRPLKRLGMARCVVSETVVALRYQVDVAARRPKLG